MDATILINVEAYRLKDLTTGPQRAGGTLHADALEIAPADPVAWTELAGPVPGLLLRAELADKPGARILLRMPDTWNGKVVAAGASGLRGEHNGDLVFSDFVLQQGYAYVSQNKGMGSWKAVSPAAPDAVPSYFSERYGKAGSRTNPCLEIALLEPRQTVAEWGYRLHQAACVAKHCARQHYGREVERCYAVGVSNGGYQVKRALECYPETFCGGLDWAGPVWRAGALNLPGELSAALRHIDAYLSKGMDPNGVDAQAIQDVGFNPDLVMHRSARPLSLWQLHRDAYWELALYVYASKTDPEAFPTDRLPSYSELTNYDPLTHVPVITACLREQHYGCSIENTGKLQRPLINLHGTADALVTLRGHALAYQALVESRSCNAMYRLYQIENGSHVDKHKGRMPIVELIQPHAHKAFGLLEQWVERDAAPTASRLLRPGETL
jgi:hypothetical protein